MPLLGSHCSPCSSLGDAATDAAAIVASLQPLEQAGANLITAGAIQPGAVYTFSPTGAITQVIPTGAVAGTTASTSGVSTLLVLGLGVLAMFLVMSASKRQ